jgi:predicted MFS family arabinose efflux permease
VSTSAADEATDQTDQTADKAPHEENGILATWRESPTAVKALLVGTLVIRLGEFVQVFMVLYLIARGFSATQAGVALGIYGVGALFGMLFAGWLSDRIGPPATIIYSLVGAGILIPTVVYLDNYVAILAVLTLAGAFSQAYRPAATSLLSRLTPANRQVMIFAMCRLAINVAASVGPLIGAALVLISYDLLFWGEAAAGFGLAAIVALTFRKAERDKATETTEAAPGEDGTTTAGYLSILTDRRYVLFLFAMFAASVIYIQYLSALPLTIHADGFGVAVYSMLLAINGAVVIACELFVAKFVQRWEPRTAVILGIALTAVGMAMYGLPWELIGLVVATLVWTFGEIIGYPTLFFAYPAQAGPLSLQGRYLGASNALYGLGCALGPIIGVAVWNSVGDVMWALCGVVGIVAVVTAWFGVRLKAELPNAAAEEKSSTGRSVS